MEKHSFRYDYSDDDDVSDLLSVMGLNDTPRPPFPDARGNWVPRIEFHGKKSFGYYTCDCGSIWTSAHAQKQYRQECKSCMASTLAHLMWVNDNIASRNRVKPDEKSDKPHLRHLCEACNKGDCTG